MNFNLLKSVREDKYGVPSFVREHSKLHKVRYYENSFSGYSYMETKQPIQLELTAWEGEKLVLRDFLRWGVGSPNCYHIVCSEKFRKVLESLHLPPHRFYDAEIDVKHKKHNYFVLHFIQDWTKDIDYSKSVFNVVALLENERIVKRLNVGEVKSLENYNEINEMLAEIDQYLYPAKLHFLPLISYDIWGLQGQIIFSEQAKQAIEQVQITGISMPDIHETDIFKDIEIVMNTKLSD